MRFYARTASIMALLLVATSLSASAGKLYGKITKVTDHTITARFEAGVKATSMMIVMLEDKESVAGMAISERCDGAGPFDVTGTVEWITEPSAFKIGNLVYVDTSRASTIPRAYVQAQQSALPFEHDLNFYYSAAWQNAGYGALGLGLERTIRLSPHLRLVADAAATARGDIGNDNGSAANSDNLIKNLGGKLKLDVFRDLGVYAGYRWTEGRSDSTRWQRISEDLSGKDLNGPTSVESGTVLLRGVEYGLNLFSSRRLSLSVGYFPEVRADYGGIGYRREPGTSAEVRLGTGHGAIRFRGIKSDGYWATDVGITIR